MWQAEVQIDLGAITSNIALLASGTSAQVMAVVKGDGYGHGAVPSARAALAGGATWLGVCTLGEAFELREAGLTTPTMAWLWMPGQPVASAIKQDIDLGVSSIGHLKAVIDAARETGQPARIHLKIDTGLSRSGATPADWPTLVEAAARAQKEGLVKAIGVWSHFVYADEPGHETIDRQLDVFHDGLEIAKRHGLDPQLRHIANSAATLTRPDTHFDLVRPGVASYGLSPVEGQSFGLRPAMTARAQAMLVKRIPQGQGISYGHTYFTAAQANVVLVPLGYADGVPRHASSSGPVQINGKRYKVSGRVCMDQFVVDVGDAQVTEGDEVILFGTGEHGEPTADDWARACGTINYEIVTRFGSARVPRTYV
ncbi:alanine racemase [Rhizocola hellebori]|uniref:Alanine racemase n=1 Tax=Rhizocola hellebori TaxID=1392758 RepID=A0A8J3Q6T2_9ACTN|nr:alanine racemase [Rhizocola hellebori]GIH04356.1 alanine racemase [Rhizocola hellebori]